MPSGLCVDPLHLVSEAVRLDDIAHNLGNICRFGGSTRWFYSVGQHSWACARVAKARYPDDLPTQRYALLHDASEAYLGDVVRPMKVTDVFACYRTHEVRAMGAILEAFGIDDISVTSWERVKEIDDDLLAVERFVLMPNTDVAWPGVKDLAEISDAEAIRERVQSRIGAASSSQFLLLAQSLGLSTKQSS